MTAALSRADFESIVRAGVQAPSADNHHPVQLEHTERAVVFQARDEYLAAPPHRKLLARIGFGAMAENMLLRARSLGWSGTLAISPSPPSDPAVIARIDFERTTAEAPALDAAIEARQTNRGFYHGPRLDERSLAELDQEAAAVSGAELRWCDGRGPRRRVARLARIAETERFRSRRLHHELFSCIHFEAGWNRSVDEGLPPGALGVERPLRAPFACLRYWPVMRAANLLGAHYALGLRAAYIPCRWAPHVAVVGATTPGLEEGAWAVGRALERLWLRVTRMGMALQPFAAPGLFALEDYEGIRLGLRHELAAGWRELMPSATPLMLLRLGRAKPLAVRTSRPSIGNFIGPKQT
jgi:hypothetical protein